MNKNTQLKKRSGKEIHIPVENKDTIKEKEAQSENNWPRLGKTGQGKEQHNQVKKLAQVLVNK